MDENSLIRAATLQYIPFRSLAQNLQDFLSRTDPDTQIEAAYHLIASDLYATSEYAEVRKAVAETGFGLDLLSLDSEEEVRNAALEALGGEDIDAWIEENPDLCADPANRWRTDVILADLDSCRESLGENAYEIARSLVGETDWFNVLTGKLISSDINADGRLYGFQTYVFTKDKASRAVNLHPELLRNGAVTYALSAIPAPGSGAHDRLGWVGFWGMDTVTDLAAMIAREDGWRPDDGESLNLFLNHAADERLPDRLVITAEMAFALEPEELAAKMAAQDAWYAAHPDAAIRDGRIMRPKTQHMRTK